ncbi:unnamed protein product [Microthlaspi erraticum]|uniref:Uncharacterized protein n=1 Tax=Microthlaspi erraticum TaxID=1685480 RepID=A0A6D2JLZ5_9BRAS|nr:unnamed protein product [Microthlaspi erraticum]
MKDQHDRAASWKLVKEYGVFDIPGSTIDYEQEICNEQSPCPGLVLLYARMGLHRYNLLEGTKFELSGVTKYVQSKGTCACCYYITLDAIDPAAVGSCFKLFRLKYQNKVLADIFSCAMLPEFEVKESELQDNDWILLYIELAIAIVKNSEDKAFGPPKLEIVKVAMDANGEGLNAINAIFYVRYKDLNEAEIGKALDRFAIVRRRFHEDTQCFSLVGSQVTPNMDSQMKALHL